MLKRELTRAEIDRIREICGAETDAYIKAAKLSTNSIASPVAYIEKMYRLNKSKEAKEAEESERSRLDFYKDYLRASFRRTYDTLSEEAIEKMVNTCFSQKKG